MAQRVCSHLALAAPSFFSSFFSLLRCAELADENAELRQQLEGSRRREAQLNVSAERLEDQLQAALAATKIAQAETDAAQAEGAAATAAAAMAATAATAGGGERHQSLK